MGQLMMFNLQSQPKPVNVAKIPMRSPFRYAGGKTWFVPYVRKWLRSDTHTRLLIEPFAGGGIISLTAAFEDMVPKVLMAEKDEDVASVWLAILSHNAKWLAEQITSFEVTPANVNHILTQQPKSLRKQAFQTILKNRMCHGGILAKGAGLIKNGEKNKGLKSRWYPKTLRNRILAIYEIRDTIDFIRQDAFEIIEEYRSNRDVSFFIDPPYTVAGRRLYKYHQIDHERLFKLCAAVQGKLIMTYDNADEIKKLADKYAFNSVEIIMKTTHHTHKKELLIGKDLSWI